MFSSARSLAACHPRETVTDSKSKKVTTTFIPENDARKKERDLIRPFAPIEKSLLGAKLGPDGAVSEETDHFEPGQTVYLTLRLHDSPVGLKTNAVWYGPEREDDFLRAEGDERRQDRHLRSDREAAAGQVSRRGSLGRQSGGGQVFEIGAAKKTP